MGSVCARRSTPPSAPSTVPATTVNAPITVNFAGTPAGGAFGLFETPTIPHEAPTTAGTRTPCAHDTNRATRADRNWAHLTGRALKIFRWRKQWHFLGEALQLWCHRDHGLNWYRAAGTRRQNR